MKKNEIWILAISFPILVVCLCFITIFISIFGSDALSKNEIFNLVNNNQDILIQTLLDSKDPGYELCGELKNKGIKQIGVCKREGERLLYMEFSCGGRMDNYFGFYFVENDAPIGYEGDDYRLREKGNGWQCVSGEYYTERIRENWFYYEMHY